MTATAITYRTGDAASKLRTVVVRDARRSVVLLPSGRLEIIQANLLHGQACAHQFWAEQLGLDPESDDFVVPAEQVVQMSAMNVKPSRRKH
jgi:hypothetical protein